MKKLNMHKIGDICCLFGTKYLSKTIVKLAKMCQKFQNVSCFQRILASKHTILKHIQLISLLSKRPILKEENKRHYAT